MNEEQQVNAHIVEVAQWVANILADGHEFAFAWAIILALDDIGETKTEATKDRLAFWLSEIKTQKELENWNK